MHLESYSPALKPPGSVITKLQFNSLIFGRSINSAFLTSIFTFHLNNDIDTYEHFGNHQERKTGDEYKKVVYNAAKLSRLFILRLEVLP